MIVAGKKMVWNCNGPSGERGGFVYWSSAMYHVKKIFRRFFFAVDTIMKGSHFPSGRKGIICAAVGDIAATDAIFVASSRKDPW